jgi:hypothetical protein
VRQKLVHLELDLGVTGCKGLRLAGSARGRLAWKGKTRGKHRGQTEGWECAPRQPRRRLAHTHPFPAGGVGNRAPPTSGMRQTSTTPLAMEACMAMNPLLRPISLTMPSPRQPLVASTCGVGLVPVQRDGAATQTAQHAALGKELHACILLPAGPPWRPAGRAAPPPPRCQNRSTAERRNAPRVGCARQTKRRPS